MENTYDWITATAVSKVNNRIWLKINTFSIYGFKLCPIFPNKVTNRWPAIILAVNRIAKVPGRIKFLVVSIKTRKGKRRLGAFWGTKWANICVVFLHHPCSINVNQKGRLIVRVSLIWLVQVKIYGNNPIKLLITININNDTKIRVLPLKLLVLIKVLNSLCRAINSLIQNILIREGLNQYASGITKIIKFILIQFKDT